MQQIRLTRRFGRLTEGRGVEVRELNSNLGSAEAAVVGKPLFRVVVAPENPCRWAWSSELAGTQALHSLLARMHRPRLRCATYSKQVILFRGRFKTLLTHVLYTSF